MNNSFEKLNKKEKLAIIYHEIGHSKFPPWKFFAEFARILLGFLPFIIFFIILFFVLDSSFWILFLILGMMVFITSSIIFWFLEIIADIYSISKIDKEHLISIIEKKYSSKKISFFNKYIAHPPWKLRKKIIYSLS